MLTSASTRTRPAFIACAALFAALLVIPRVASAAGHGGGGHGGGHGGGFGGTHGGGGHFGGGGSHASSFHGGSRGGVAYHGGSRGGGWHGGGGHWGGGGSHASGSHAGNHGGVAHHGGGWHGGGWHGGFNHHAGWGYYPYRCGYYPYGWGWGWSPYYSSWGWGGGPSVYVVAGDGDSYAVDTARYDDQWSDLSAAPASYERFSEENMDVREEPLPQPAGYRSRMRFKVTPADAAIYVDDKYLGAGADLAANARGVVTIPGAHTITVARPGYKTKTVHINARIVTPVDVVVELER